MAVYKETLNGVKVKIHNVDHLPPHCHAYIDNKDVRINLLTLEVMNPPPLSVPPKINKAIRKEQEVMLEAWDEVKIIPRGGNPGDW